MYKRKENTPISASAELRQIRDAKRLLATLRAPNQETVDRLRQPR
jgi:hypothetical protein